MKLGVSMYSYVRAVHEGRLDHVGFVREAAAIGAEGVELLDFFSKDPASELDLIREALAETGLACGVYSVSNNFAKPDPAEREAQLQRVRFGVDQALLYGAGVVRVFAGDVGPGLGYDECRAWIVDGLARASDYAHERGVRLGLENHGRLAGRSAQVAAIIAEVRDRCGHDALGANPDTGNFLLVDEDPTDAVTALAPLATMAHVKDFCSDPGGRFVSDASHRFEGCPITEGVVDIASALQELAGKSTDVWVNVEFEGPGDPMVDVSASVHAVRSILTKIHLY